MTDIVTLLGGILVAIAGIFFYGKSERRKGRAEVVDEIDKADRQEAGRIRERLNADGRDGDPLERLRASGRLRD